MKKFCIVLILVLIIAIKPVLSQKAKKIKVYKAWVISDKNKKIGKGVLYRVKDSSIVLAPTLPVIEEKLQEIPIKRIKFLKIRRKGRITKGILLGLVAGAAIGFPVGYAMGGDGEFIVTDTDAGIVMSILMAGPGMIVGGIVGSQKKKIPFHGNQRAYEEQKAHLKKGAIWAHNATAIDP